jgi:L-ascorbate metabolism protein UlaG (beta-lactamase superfamily)
MLGRDTKFTWYGHGTWLIQSPGGVRIVVDPWLSNPSRPADLADPTADIVLLTHGHVDHIADAVSLATTSGAPVVAKVELATWIGEQGVEDVVGFNVGGATEVKGIGFTMTQAIHSGSIQTMDGAVGYGGEPAGYIITFENGFRVYFAGDTAVFGDMALLREIYAPDLAILPIGDFYTMGPLQAAHAVRLLGVQHVVGSHWGTFPALTGTPDALEAELARLDLEDVAVHKLQAGFTLE